MNPYVKKTSEIILGCFAVVLMLVIASAIGLFFWTQIMRPLVVTTSVYEPGPSRQMERAFVAKKMLCTAYSEWEHKSGENVPSMKDICQ